MSLDRLMSMTCRSEGCPQSKTLDLMHLGGRKPVKHAEGIRSISRRLM
jgi:hypothetical protein